MAYTKYSLTPANNNATPPDGAPEGMLPSAVNDTMRDMMAQIRDVGDGIRNGTYTMTAPVITGGSITGVALSGNTFTNPVITGGSINNTPIGASTANSGAFTTLSASGATTFSGATVVSGSLTANTFSSSGATITGGSINNTTIGGSTAAAGTFTSLSDSGNLTFTGTGNRITGDFSNATIANRVGFQSSTTNGNTDVQVIPNGTSVTSGIRLNNNSDPTNAGYVRLSLNSTEANLSVDRNSVSGTYIPLGFNTGGSERLRIDTSGNVGIGTSSPPSYTNQTTLGINGTTYGRLDVMSGGTVRGSFYGGSSGSTLASSGANPLGFETNGTERMRITSGGRLNIGTTGGSATRLEIEGGETMCAFINTSATDANYKTTMAFTDSGGTTRGTIRVNNSATQYNTSSDYRLKENIAPMASALSKIQALKPCTYTWKIDGHAGQGFIAHELAEVFPDAVAGEKDAVETYIDEEGNEQTRPVYQGVDTSFLVATLTAAIQEQQAMIEELKQEVAALKAK